MDYVLEQIRGAGTVSARKMFGDYGVYRGDKIVALICDDLFYVKPTAAGRACLGDVVEAPPYPGAKPYFLVSGDKWDDSEWMSQLVRRTADDLPAPKLKPKRAVAKKRASK